MEVGAAGAGSTHEVDGAGVGPGASQILTLEDGVGSTHWEVGAGADDHSVVLGLGSILWMTTEVGAGVCEAEDQELLGDPQSWSNTSVGSA